MREPEGHWSVLEKVTSSIPSALKEHDGFPMAWNWPMPSLSSLYAPILSYGHHLGRFPLPMQILQSSQKVCALEICMVTTEVMAADLSSADCHSSSLADLGCRGRPQE
ncbi:unnamed protein product [Arctogadus glacialis]